MHKVGEFCWNQLATFNLQGSKDFYGKVFGWKFTDHEMGDMLYTTITRGDQQFGGMWQVPVERREEVRPHWMSYVLVDNLEETLEKAKQLGAVERTPIRSTSNSSRFVVIVDPLGAYIALWESKTI